jgi:hypothetical protein
MIAAYRAGTTAASLASAHGLSLRSVKRLLSSAGDRRLQLPAWLHGRFRTRGEGSGCHHGVVLRRWRRERIEARAVTHLVHQAILYIRGMAYLRRTMLDDYFPGADYQEQIRLLADMCDTLVPGIAGDHSSRAALLYTYRSRGPQREWMISTLSTEGIDLLRLLQADLEDVDSIE